MDQERITTFRIMSSGRVFMINPLAQQNLLRTWIMPVIAKQHLVRTGRIGGPTEF
jgi:hypothetical protein